MNNLKYKHPRGQVSILKLHQNPPKYYRLSEGWFTPTQVKSTIIRNGLILCGTRQK